MDKSEKKSRGRPKKIPLLLMAQNEIVEQSDNIIEEVVSAPPSGGGDDDFLSDLNNDVFAEAEMTQQDKLNNKEETAFLKNLIKDKSKAKKEKAMPLDDNELFSDKGSIIIGKDRRRLIAKINQYKNLFKTELKGFKIKKDASLQELQSYLEEAESIVETSGIGGFLNDSILSSLKLVEGVSSYTKYDVSGMSDLLKGNPQFNSLLKQLYLKYSVFDKVPPEYQLILIVATTAYVCNNKNKGKASFNSYLSEPYVPPPV